MKAIRLFFARRAYAKANEAYKAYSSWDKNKNWSVAIAVALQNDLFKKERIVSALINS